MTRASRLVVAFAFGFVPFVLVVAVAALYTRLGDAGALRAVFYGVGPVVVALIVKGCWTLGRRTLRRDARAGGAADVRAPRWRARAGRWRRGSPSAHPDARVDGDI